MKAKEAFNVAVRGAQWLARCVQDDGKFIYGYDIKTRKHMDDYNILRHAGSVWSMLDIYHDFPDSYIASRARRALDWMLDHHTTRWQQHLAIYEDNYIKLGGNGLAILALLYYCKAHSVPAYKRHAISLTDYIFTCQKKNKHFNYHKRHYQSGKDKGFTSDFYQGEALLGMFHTSLYVDHYYSLAKDTCKYYWKLREKEGHIRDHWMCQALEFVQEHDWAKQYAHAIAKTTLKGLSKYKPGGDKNYGPAGCRSESLLSAYRITGEPKYLKAVQQLLTYQKGGQIVEGPDDGAFIHKPNSTEVRNDYTQHNISSFIRYYRLAKLL